MLVQDMAGSVVICESGAVFVTVQFTGVDAFAESYEDARQSEARIYLDPEMARRLADAITACLGKT